EVGGSVGLITTGIYPGESVSAIGEEVNIIISCCSVINTSANGGVGIYEVHICIVLVDCSSVGISDISVSGSDIVYL
ncbi:MAG: hypothetical protein ACTSWQ_05915, partial [Candidatus Thorarchaeota archaeon]